MAPALSREPRNTAPSTMNPAHILVPTARESFVPPRSIAKAVIDLNISNPLQKDKHDYRKSNKKGSGEFAALHRTCSRLLLLFQQFELFCIPSLPDLDEIQPGFQVTSN